MPPIDALRHPAPRQVMRLTAAFESAPPQPRDLLAALAGGYPYVFSKAAVREAERAPELQIRRQPGNHRNPDDPYDIEADLAKKRLSYDGMALTPEEQKCYDYAMQNSNERGPCCCQCWRWQVYGGLGKYLLRSHGFTGEQVTQIWNLSDGCGGEADHVWHA